jgi:hypothetical protein
MAHQRMQRNRFEYKYLIDERCAREVRDFARAYLVRDEHAIPELKWAYPTHSIYLDGPGLPLYYSTVHGHKNRFKLRVRFYTEKDADPVFFEVKRRVHDTILKDRALVHRHRALGLMNGETPRREDLVNPADLDAWSSLRRFHEMQSNIGARPRVFVSYMREAWIKPDDDHVRLTFDRDLYGGKFDGTFHVKKEVKCPPLLPGAPCVLELKFTDRFPFWFREMVRSLNLERRQMAKYCQTTFWVPRKNQVDSTVDFGTLDEVMTYG